MSSVEYVGQAAGLPLRAPTLPTGFKRPSLVQRARSCDSIRSSLAIIRGVHGLFRMRMIRLTSTRSTSLIFPADSSCLHPDSLLASPVSAAKHRSDAMVQSFSSACQPAQHHPVEESDWRDQELLISFITLEKSSLSLPAWLCS